MQGIARYLDTKESGVDWLGDVPKHWSIRRLRTVATIVSGATPSTSIEAYWDGPILWITPEDLGASGSPKISESARKITHKGLESCGTTLVDPRSVVISTRAPIGHLGILSTSGCTNQGCKTLVPTEQLHAEFLYHTLETVRGKLQSLGQGATFTELSTRHLSTFSIGIPPISEQETIVHFLDRVNYRVQRYIAAKEKLIELLDEYRRSAIQEAVTGRIDLRTGRPFPEYKDLEFGWIEEIPAHWQVASIRRYCKVFSGATPSRTEPRYWSPGTIPWLSSGDVNRRMIQSASQFISEEGLNSSGTNWIRPQSLVLALAGQGKTKGKVASIELATTCNQSLAAIEPDLSRCCHDYLAYYLENRYKDIRSLVGDALRDGLNLEHVKSLPTLLPPLAEQFAIASYLSKVSADIDTAVQTANYQIRLINEYRTRLIADVVTGKLDVRKAAEGLPVDANDLAFDGKLPRSSIEPSIADTESR